LPIAAAIAEVNAQAQEILRPLPPGIFPPLIIQYNAASVPVVLASLSSEQLPEQELNDWATASSAPSSSPFRVPPSRCPTAARCAS